MDLQEAEYGPVMSFWIDTEAYTDRDSSCKKRFMSYWYECDDGGCWHERFPKHRANVKQQS